MRHRSDLCRIFVFFEDSHRAGRFTAISVAVQTLIALVAMLLSGVITLLITLAIKHTIGWRISRQQEFEGIDYSMRRETGYDFGGPGMRPGGFPAGNKAAADLGLNEAREHHEPHSRKAGTTQKKEVATHEKEIER